MQNIGKHTNSKKSSSAINLTQLIGYIIYVLHYSLIIVYALANKKPQLHTQVKRDQRLVKLSPAAARVGKFNIYPGVVNVFA